MATPWIIEGNIDSRWPINTRGNVGEVYPEVVTPLSYKLGVLPGEKAWREAYRVLGLLKSDDFSSSEPVIIGLYGGYVYLNLSYLRMMGVRAPGSSAEAIDVSFFGEGNPPKYVPRKGDKSFLSSLKILKVVLNALNAKKLPKVVAESFEIASHYETQRPPLDASDDELIEFLHSFPDAFFPAFRNHMLSSALAAVVSGTLADASAAAGEPGLVTHLVGASGDVHSAKYSNDLYQIAKKVKEMPAVNSEFDAGVEGLLERLEGRPEAKEFFGLFEDFVTEHGHRGPNDWEISSRTWENSPELALMALDRMRVAEYDLSPSVRLQDNESKRLEAAKKVRPHLGFKERLQFDKALKSASFWAQAREATRDRAVRVNLPAKQVYRELVRRAAQRGGHPDPVRVALLDPYSELPEYLKNPDTYISIIEERGKLFDRFSEVTPPFFISSQEEVLTLEELEEIENSLDIVQPARSGDVLTGNAGSSGNAKGRARIVMDPADALNFEPGDVLIAPFTDPAWTPLFLPAAAVVVNVGALMSHAIIVSRELGIPCVVAVEGATEKIPEGAMIEVDGTAGTVKLLD